MRAALPTNEEERLAHLSELKILDSLPEPSFDLITVAISELLDVPTACVVFLDSDRQWAKAKLGLDLSETHREISFCAHTILKGATLVVPDTTLDPRFSDNPLVTSEPYYRFYAGAPVFFKGYPVGTVCCLDTRPQELTEHQINGLVAIAAQVSALLDARSISMRFAEIESRFSSVIESMHDGLLVWDENCVVVLANQRAHEMFGLEPSQLLGCSPYEAMVEIFDEEGKPWDKEKHPALVALRKGVPQSGDIFDFFKPGNSDVTSLMCNCVPLFRPGSSVPHAVVTTLTDVTERKRMRVELTKLNSELKENLEETSTELSQFFSISLDMLCISNVEGYFTRVSPAFTDVLGWSEEELLTRPKLSFVHPDDAEATRGEHLAYLSVRGPRQFENRLRTKDGHYRTLWWKSVPLSNGLIYSAGRDVTEQRELEEGLKMAVEEARQANLAKSEFLSRMSHELRTPMNAVLGYAQLLELKYDEPNIRAATGSILKGGNHLLQLINQVLDLSKIESGNLGISMEAVDLVEILNQAAGLLEMNAREARIHLIVEDQELGGANVLADRQRLLQVLINLIGNGIKYNKTEGTVTVRGQEFSPGKFRIEVQDTGIGIPHQFWPLLFQPFQRFSDPGIEGSGLGLAISQRFASLMGGELGLLESTEQGTTFYLDLEAAQPLEKTPVQSGGEQVRPRVFTNYGTVLYIEDNLSNIRLIESVLVDWTDVQLIPAMQGFVGLELARSQKPDLILLDIHLPDIMGDKVLEKLKSDPSTRDIPVVVLSADATKRQIESSLSKGALDYLTKPIDLKKLYDLIGSILPHTH